MKYFLHPNIPCSTEFRARTGLELSNSIYFYGHIATYSQQDYELELSWYSCVHRMLHAGHSTRRQPLSVSDSVTHPL